MALQGNLDVWRVTDVLRMLAATDKTGYLRVDEEERQGGVWFRDGSISAATTDRVPQGPLVEALSDVLRFCGGSFDFTLDDRAPAVDRDCPVDDVIREAQGLREEWDSLRAGVPSLDCGVELVGQIPVAKMTISAGLWRAVAAVADGCTISMFASRLGLTEFGALRVLHELMSSGLLIVGVTRQEQLDAVAARLS